MQIDSWCTPRWVYTFLHHTAVISKGLVQVTLLQVSISNRIKNVMEDIWYHFCLSEQNIFGDHDVAEIQIALSRRSAIIKGRLHYMRLRKHLWTPQR